MRHGEYRGMSYEQASREALRLVRLGWFQNFDRLMLLHEIMSRELEASTRYFSREEWGRLSIQMKNRWWEKTDYLHKEPSPELLQEFRDALNLR